MSIINDLQLTNGNKVNGKAMASMINKYTFYEASKFLKLYGVQPTYVVIMVGDNKASERYVNNKKKTSEDFGIKCIVDIQPDTITQDNLIELIIKYNLDINVHGIIVQLPLPKHINPKIIAETICHTKDVDGLNPINIGKLNNGTAVPGRIPCTPMGICLMLNLLGQELEALNVVIIGRSDIVGRPLRALLEQRNCTVILSHSYTDINYLKSICKEADIIISAVGKPGFIDHSFITYGQIIIDVGTTVVEGKLYGDVNLTDMDINDITYITPVPGGVGPMTVAMLLNNVVTNAFNIGGPTIL